MTRIRFMTLKTRKIHTNMPGKRLKYVFKLIQYDINKHDSKY